MQPENVDHDDIMCVWCEINGKEVNSNCEMLSRKLSIIRHTILGGIGVIQQRLLCGGKWL